MQNTEESQAITRVTTEDTDVHDVIGDVDHVRYKADKGMWLLTTDGRYVKGSKIVSAWTPTEEDGDLV